MPVYILERDMPLEEYYAWGEHLAMKREEWDAAHPKKR